MTIQSINPFTEEVIKTYNLHTEPEIREILKLVQKEWESWRKTDFTFRKNLMLNLAGNLKNEKKLFA